MPAYTGNLTPLVADAALVEYRLRGVPRGSRLHIPGPLHSGRSTAAGGFGPVTLEELADDDPGYFTLEAEGESWRFQTRAGDGIDINQLITLFYVRHPTGDTTVERFPAPGPPGPVEATRRLPQASASSDTSGPIGPEGSSYHFIFTEAPEGTDPPTPVGGTVNTDNGVVVPPAGYSNALFIPAAGNAIFESFTVVHHTHVGVVIPVWAGVGPVSGIGRPGAVGPRGAKGDRSWTPIYQTHRDRRGHDRPAPRRVGARRGPSPRRCRGIPERHRAHERRGGRHELQGPPRRRRRRRPARRQGPQGLSGRPGGGLTYDAIQGLPRHQPGRLDQFPFIRVGAGIDAHAGCRRRPEVQAMAAPIKEILDEQDRLVPLGALDHQTIVWDAVTERDEIGTHLYGPGDFLPSRHRVPRPPALLVTGSGVPGCHDPVAVSPATAR